MKVTLVLPCIGKKPGGYYVPTWQMEPLGIVTLAGLTPRDIELCFFDDRIEEIDFDIKTDLVGISVETYTARRAYQISEEFRKRGVPVILGGYHATLVPDEAGQHASSILTGYAENLWQDILQDTKHGNLKKIYTQNHLNDLNYCLPDRSILGDRKYLKIHCVETSRGCPHHCKFCAIAAASRSQYSPIPIDRVVADVASLKHRVVLFVDDNFTHNVERTITLLREIEPFKLRWVTQGSLHMAKNEKLLKQMARSGCVGILVGFESFKAKTLRELDKNFMLQFADIKKHVDIIHNHGIGIYGSFIFGVDTEDMNDCMNTAKEALSLNLFLAAFAPLLPFPGTKLYQELKDQDRLINDPWWLNENYHFNDVAFFPKNMSPEKLRELCIEERRKFYSFSSIFKRLGNIKGNAASLRKISTYLYANYLLRNEIDKKDGLPLGV